MTALTVAGLAVETAGEGFPMVMIHGLGGTANTFQPQMEALHSYRVIRIDLPGAGRSPLGHAKPSLDSFADDVVRVLGALGVSRAHFVGHSMGTLVCQCLAAERPDFVESLLLFGALIEPSESMRTGLPNRARTARSEGMAPIAEQIVEGALSPDTRASRPITVAFVRESIMRQDPEGYAQHCEALARMQAVEHRRIAAPALLVAGESDGMATAGVARDLAGRLKSARVAVVERSGHWLTVERPNECNRIMGEFLTSLH